MKILFVLHDINFRGGEKFFFNLCGELSKKNHIVEAVAGRLRKTHLSLSREVKIYSPPNILNNFIQNNILFVLFSIPAIFFLTMQRVKKTDIVYSSESIFTLLPSFLAAKLSGKKLVIEVFELGNEYLDHKVGNFNKSINFLNKLLVPKADYVITVNNSLASVLKNKFRAKNVAKISPGIKLNKRASFHDLKKLQEKYYGKKILVMPGVIHPAKNQDFALKILSMVIKTFPNTILILVGGGDKEFKKTLIGLSEKLNVENNLCFTGFISDKNLLNYYKISDMVLMCGPIAGLTIAESLLLKKMPIYLSSGNPPLGPVEEYNVGMIVKNKNAKDFSKKIISYLKNPQKYKNKLLRDAGIIKKELSMERFTNQTVEIFREVLK